jgi:Membrane protein involved in the export of O-antigen and teichoic acid
MISARWRRVFDLVLGAGIVQGTSILTNILLARWLPQVEYGSYRQLFLLNQLLWAIGFSAIPTALMYFASRVDGAAAVAGVIRKHLGVVTVIALVPAIILAVMPGAVAALFDNPSLERLLPLFAPYPAAYMFHSLVATVMVTRGRTAGLPVYMSAIALLNSAAVLLTAHWTADLRVIIGVASLAAVLGAGAALALMLAMSRGAGSSGLRLREIAAYAVPLLLASGISVLGLRFDQFAVAHTLGTAMFAVYAVGAFELPLYSLLKSSSTAALMPEIAAAAKVNDWSAVLSVWQDLLRKNAAMVLPLSAALVIFAEEFITVLFGTAYRAAAPVFAIFSLLGPLRAVTFGLILRALGRTSLDFAAAVAFLVFVALAINPALRIGGLTAAAATVVSATALVALLLVILTVRASGGRIRAGQLYPPKYLLAYAALLGAFYALRLILDLAAAGALAQLAIAAFCAAALSFTQLRGLQRLTSMFR